MTNIIDQLSQGQLITPGVLKSGHVLAAGGNVQPDGDNWHVSSNGTTYTIVDAENTYSCPCPQGKHYGITVTVTGKEITHFCKHIAAVIITKELELTLSKPQNLFEMVVGIVANQAIHGPVTELYVKKPKHPGEKKVIVNLVQDVDVLRLKKGRVVSEPVAKMVDGRWMMVFDSLVNYLMWGEEIKQ